MKSMLQVLSCDLVGKALLALVGALLIRYMTQAEYARYSVAYALMLVFIQICSGCLSRVYLIGYDRFDFRSDGAVLARLQFALVCVGVPVLLLLVGPSRPLAWTCAAAMALGCGTEFLKSRFQQEMRFGRFSSVEFIRAAVVSAGVAAVVWGSGFRPAAFPIFAVQFASFCVVFLLYGMPPLALAHRKAWRETARLARKLWAGPYRYLFLYFLILALFNQIDLLVLRYVGTEHQLAAYAAAYRYYNVLLLALTAANAVMLPAVQRSRSSYDAAAIRRQHLAALLMFLPVVGAAILAAGFLLPAVDGGRYPESPAIFRVLAVSSLLSFALSPAMNVVLCQEDFRFLTRIAAVACALGPALNLVLIPRFGPVGTAWSVLFSMAALNGAGFWRASRHALPETLAVAA